VEGRDIALPFRRLPEGNQKEIDKLVDTVVRDRPDVIVLAGDPMALQSLKNRTRDIPVVFYNFMTNPVDFGIAESLSRPGGNFTGATATFDWGSALEQEWQLVKRLVPSVKRAAIIADKKAWGQKFWDETSKMDRAAGARVGIEVLWLVSAQI